MATIADAIEAYLKQLIGAHSGYIEIRRCDLADSFACAPSQINYVLETRFSVNHGYIVESRRGGGGYIRIKRVTLQTPSSLYAAVSAIVGDQISDAAAIRLLRRLVENGVLSQARAEQLARFLIAQTSGIKAPWDEICRAMLLNGMLFVLLQNPDSEVHGGEINDV